jgi:hypothetical protein
MGRRSSWQFAKLDRERQEKKRMNPIWRGVGCSSIAFFTLLGYLFSGWFLTQNAANRWVYLPPAIINPSLPRQLSFLRFIQGGTLVQFIVAFIFMLFAIALVNFVYAIAFPIRPGDLDVPPLKRKRG